MLTMLLVTNKYCLEAVNVACEIDRNVVAGGR